MKKSEGKRTLRVPGVDGKIILMWGKMFKVCTRIW